MAQETVQKFKAEPLFGTAYEVTEADIIQDAQEKAQSFSQFKECDTITYGMVPTFRDLSTMADDVWRGAMGVWPIDEGQGFEIWCDTFEAEIERLGFYITGDEGDGTVTWLHVKDCKCAVEEE